MSDRAYLIRAVVTAALFFGAGVVILRFVQGSPGGYRLAASFNVLAGLTVVTLGLERLLEPLRNYLLPETETLKNELADASVDAQSASPLAASSEVAEKQVAVNQSRRKAAVLMWGIASGAGFLIAAATNVLLLHSIAAEGSTVPPLEIDLLLTGLIIGAGTKPVHDLVSRIEKSKSNAEDKAVRARSAPGPAATLPATPAGP